MAMLPMELENGRRVQVILDSRYADSEPYIQIVGNNVYLKGADMKRALEIFKENELPGAF